MLSDNFDHFHIDCRFEVSFYPSLLFSKAAKRREMSKSEGSKKCRGKKMKFQSSEEYKSFHSCWLPWILIVSRAWVSFSPSILLLLPRMRWERVFHHAMLSGKSLHSSPLHIHCERRRLMRVEKNIELKWKFFRTMRGRKRVSETWMSPWWWNLRINKM